MALSQPYCTLEDVQKEARNTDSAQTTWFETCINRASRHIEFYCGKDFLYHNHAVTAYSVPPGDIATNKVNVPWPIITLTSVLEDAVSVASTNYYFVPGGRNIVRNGDWSRSEYKTTIQLYGTFGYALDGTNPTTAPPPTIPAGIRRACTLIAANWTCQNRKEVVGSDGNRESVLDTKIPKEAMDLLKLYKRHVVL